MRNIKAWHWAILGFVVLLLSGFLFFYAHWFSYRLGARHMDEQILYPVAAAILLLPHCIGVWVLTAFKKIHPFWAILITLLFVCALFCIPAGYNGGCPMCDSTDRVFQWLHTRFYGSPLIAG